MKDKVMELRKKIIKLLKEVNKFEDAFCSKKCQYEFYETIKVIEVDDDI